MTDKDDTATREGGQGLEVVQTAERQFRIENPNPDINNWEATYVCLSGFVGSHGPHVFAAAPDMLEALRAVAEWVDQRTETHPADAWDMVQAAIAKAEGKA